MRNASRRLGLTTCTPRRAALRGPKRRPREADREERPDLPTGYACTDARASRALQHACSARTDAFSLRAQTRTLRVLRRLPGASPSAQTKGVFRRATGTSCDVHPTRLLTRTQRVLRRAAGTLLRHAKCLHSEPACFDSGFVAVIFSGWATLVFNHNNQERRALAVPLVNRGLCSFIGFPGHALHELGLQRQLGIGTLVAKNKNEERPSSRGCGFVRLKTLLTRVERPGYPHACV